MAVKISVTMADDVYNDVMKIKRKKNIKTKSETIEMLVRKGLTLV